MSSARLERPLSGVRVAITRAREQSRELTDRLRALGADVLEVPAISIAPLEDYSQMDAAIARLESYDWVIFTSVNGVAALATRMADLNVGIDRLRRARLGAIGPATAAALERIGCTASFVPDTYVAEAVIEQIDDVRGCRVLLPRADIARKALADGLRQKGALVDEVTAYRTVPGEGSQQLAGLLRSDGVDAITFTSSSTVRYTVESLETIGLTPEQVAGLLNRAIIVCIGPVTARTADEYGLKVARVAEEYTADGLVAALVSLLGDSNDGGSNAESEQ